MSNEALKYISFVNIILISDYNIYLGSIIYKYYLYNSV